MIRPHPNCDGSEDEDDILLSDFARAIGVTPTPPADASPGPSSGPRTPLSQTLQGPALIARIRQSAESDPDPVDRLFINTICDWAAEENLPEEPTVGWYRRDVDVEPSDDEWHGVEAEDREHRVLDMHTHYNDGDSDATARASNDSDDSIYVRASPSLDITAAAGWNSRYQCPYKAPPPPPPGLVATPKAMACEQPSHSQRHSDLIRAACATPPEDSSEDDASEMERVCGQVRSPVYEEAQASGQDMPSMSPAEPYAQLCSICNHPSHSVQVCSKCNRLSCADTCTATIDIPGSPTRHLCKTCLYHYLSER